VNEVGEEDKVNMSKKGSDGRLRVQGGTRSMDESRQASINELWMKRGHVKFT